MKSSPITRSRSIITILVLASIAGPFPARSLAFQTLTSQTLFTSQTLTRPYEPTSDVSARLARETSSRAEELRRRWDLDGAQAAFRKAVSADPSSLDALLGLAKIARVRFHYAEALRLLGRAARTHSDSADLSAEYGALYLAAEDVERARRYMDQALKIDESCQAAIIGRAAVDLLERDYASAETRLRNYIAHNPESSGANSLLARVLLENDKNAEAAAKAERGVALDPFNTDALYLLAFAKATDHKTDEVRELARRAISLDPLNIGARRLLSQYVDGRAGYNQKVSIEASRRYEQGKALKRAGRLEEAVSQFELALSLEPRYYRALLALGDIWLREGDYERAAMAARLAIESDGDGALAHSELSYACLGMQERARIEIGASDFAALYYEEPAAPRYELTDEIFPNYKTLSRRQQRVIDRAVAPLAEFLPKLAEKGARHYLLPFDERVSEIKGFDDIVDDKTFDGRFYASIRGVGGRITVSGIEYIEMASHGGFNTIAHEFAHQVHMTAMTEEDVKEVRKLYKKATKSGLALDYYAASNEYEYFAQGYEAFISERKRPSAGITARHTRRELMMRDPDLYLFLEKLTTRSRAAPSGTGKFGYAPFVRIEPVVNRVPGEQG